VEPTPPLNVTNRAVRGRFILDHDLATAAQSDRRQLTATTDRLTSSRGDPLHERRRVAAAVRDPLGPPHDQIFHIQSVEGRHQILPGQAELVDHLLGVHWSAAPLKLLCYRSQHWKIP
jgi:hypothetical protein